MKMFVATKEFKNGSKVYKPGDDVPDLVAESHRDSVEELELLTDISENIKIEKD